MSKKRVLIFSTSYSPFMSGAEIAIKEITNRLGTEDFCFDMITLRFDKTLSSFEKVGNINVCRVASPKLLPIAIKEYGSDFEGAETNLALRLLSITLPSSLKPSM